MDRLTDAASLLPDSCADAASRHSPTVQKAVLLARRLQERAAALQTPSERRQQAELDRMLQNPSDKATLIQMTDQAFRARDRPAPSDTSSTSCDVQGVPRFFRPWERAAAGGVSGVWPITARRRAAAGEGAHAQGGLQRHPAGRKGASSRGTCAERRPEGVRMNVNFLGEAILGEGEAERRLQQYLSGPAVAGDRSGLDQDLDAVLADLAAGPRAHGRRAVRPAGAAVPHGGPRDLHSPRRQRVPVPKFVYLDMEEYRDKELTAEAFMRTLDRAGHGARPGRHRAADPTSRTRSARCWRLQEWARRRVGKRRRAHHDPAGQGREHGDGAGRGVAAGLAAGALQDASSRRTRTTSGWSTR